MDRGKGWYSKTRLAYLEPVNICFEQLFGSKQAMWWMAYAAWSRLFYHGINPLKPLPGFKIYPGFSPANHPEPAHWQWHLQPISEFPELRRALQFADHLVRGWHQRVPWQRAKPWWLVRQRFRGVESGKQKWEWYHTLSKPIPSLVNDFITMENHHV